MNTPLQQAAQAVLDRWDSNEYNNAYLGVHITTLRKALADEQAQAVEPVAIYDIGVNEKLGAVHLLKQLKSGDKLYTHPAQPAATGERAKVGDSRFESWYSELHQVGKGSKQIAREAYEAGLNEARQVAVPADARKAIGRYSIQADQGAGELESKWDRMAESQKTEWEGIAQAANFLQQVAVPDMFWNHDDADTLYSSISEFLNDEICNGTELAVGDIRTIQRAVRLPNIDIRITSVDEDKCDAEYEIVEAQGDSNARKVD